MSFEQHHAVPCGLMCSGARDFVLSFGFTSFFVNQEINRPLVALVLWSWVSPRGSCLLSPSHGGLFWSHCHLCVSGTSFLAQLGM